MFNPDIHHRHSLRLQGYDYSQSGAYFITVCTYNRQCLFGDIVNREIRLNEFGKVIAGEWLKSSKMRKELIMDEYVVMPNHFHGIVFINRDNNLGRGVWPYAPTLHGTSPYSIGAFVQGFKSTITRQINELRHAPSSPVWQRNYYEHVIRDDDDLNRIREYIENNPARWDEDEENPSRAKPLRQV
ncbi:MAG: transposase [Dehalococcoidia bacterium]|nr:MAG: transposase [Dehalococcoidia bacterium]